MEIQIKLNTIILSQALKVFHKKTKIFAICMSIFLIVIGILEAFSLKNNFDSFGLFLAVFCLLFGIFYIVYFMLIINRNIKLNIRQFEQANNDTESEVVFIFTDNGIENKSLTTNNVVSFTYSMINKCIDSKDFIFLITSLKQFLYIPKNQLTQDEYNKLIEIIQDHGLRYKKTK
ncbi:MAG: YcxB family protein [Staphylococcus sp.]|jgi:hypothetical protein|nr:YcxB family protein [Staphylococcus sp.]